MQIFYDERFVLPLPSQHRFLMQNYEQLYDQVRAGSVVPAPHVRARQPVSDREIVLAHSESYRRQVDAGTLPAQAQRKIGFPWSTQLGERERRVAGATIAACRAELAASCAGKLAVRTHHAFHEHGAGYCV